MREKRKYITAEIEAVFKKFHEDNVDVLIA